MALLTPTDTARRLAELKAEAAQEYASRTPPTPAEPPRGSRLPTGVPWSGLAIATLVAASLVALPFAVLVRGSVHLYQRNGYPVWLALATAATATLVVVSVYGVWLARRFTTRARFWGVTKWVAAPLVLGYCGHALLYVSRTNAKADEVRQEYRATHPLLRLALSTLILANHELLITDLSRMPPDYSRMRLPVNDRSLHYRQRDGWAHAVDLRTTGRGAIANWMVERYFRAMGFRTLRHVGTADHLHVELPMR